MANLQLNNVRVHPFFLLLMCPQTVCFVVPIVFSWFQDSGHMASHGNTTTFSIRRELSLCVYAFLRKEIFLRISPVNFSSYFIGQNYLTCLCLSKRKTITKTRCFNQVLFLKQEGCLLDRQTNQCSAQLFIQPHTKKSLLCTYYVYA